MALATLDRRPELALVDCKEVARRLGVSLRWIHERTRLGEIPCYRFGTALRFDLAEVSFPKVDGSGCVRVRTNFYSVPLPVDTRVQAKVYADRVEIWHEGAAVARHERCYDRQKQILDLEHYLEVLEQKPGALAGSTPLKQWRERGRWPQEYDRYWEVLIRRQGKQAGTRQMIELLGLGKKHGYDHLQQAMSLALANGCGDVAAVRYLLTAEASLPPPLASADLGGLARYERPLPGVQDYDQLLSREVTA